MRSTMPFLRSSFERDRSFTPPFKLCGEKKNCSSRPREKRTVQTETESWSKKTSPTTTSTENNTQRHQRTCACHRCKLLSATRIGEPFLRMEATTVLLPKSATPATSFNHSSAGAAGFSPKTKRRDYTNHFRSRPLCLTSISTLGPATQTTAIPTRNLFLVV